MLNLKSYISLVIAGGATAVTIHACAVHSRERWLWDMSKASLAFWTQIQILTKKLTHFLIILKHNFKKNYKLPQILTAVKAPQGFNLFIDRYPIILLILILFVLLWIEVYRSNPQYRYPYSEESQYHNNSKYYSRLSYPNR